jgi:hypothetical protein
MEPNMWFFAEWISVMGTFLVCFAFLFHQNQVQSARSDKLYEMFCTTQKEIREERKELDQKFYDLLKEGRK